MKFYTKTGHLTGYALACGYVENYGDWLNGDGVRLFADGGVFHVRGNGRWEVYDRMTDARAYALTVAPFNPASDAFSGI